MASRHRTTKNEDITPYEHLWRAVLSQALIDALSISPSVENRLEKLKAINWIKSGIKGKNRDFDEVCDMADLSINYVKELYLKALKKVGIL